MFIIRETFRFLRESWRAWLLQAITLGVALAVSGLFLLLAWNAREALHTIRANIAIDAFFDPALSSDAAASIAAEIEKLPGVHKMIFISKEEAARDYAHASGEDIEQTLGMNPLPASVKVYLDNPTSQELETISSRIHSLSGMDDVKIDTELVSRMETRSKLLDRIALILSALLLLSALIQSIASARHSVERRNETNVILERLGASRMMRKAPLVIFSAGAGCMAGICAFGILLLVRDQSLSMLGMEGFQTPATVSSISLFVWFALTGFAIGSITMLVNVIRPPRTKRA